ncbi:hypothetical protein [Candidatus Chlorohelix sp.]|uniref:hypothetical protein n=1 Tax=Candidatus Chlorohelix sp. TaxID=3139201 RepID=UPI00302BFC99
MRREGDSPNGCKLEARYGTSYESMMAGCYWDYLRVYVPEGSQLLDSSDFISDGSTVETLSEAGKTATIMFSYRLPLGVEVDNQYRLLVQKQPGTDAIPLKVEALDGTIWQGTLQTDWVSTPMRG